MKKLIYILHLMVLAVAAQAQPVCCPKFTLQQAQEIRACQGDTSCKAGSTVGPAGNPQTTNVLSLVACKNSTQIYLVVPNLPGFTYSWQVTGGTPSSFTGNPGIITWGSGSQGFIKVLISNSDGTCKDSILAKVCLLNAPVAAFTVNPGSTVCINSPTVQFTNTSLGATSYNWNFGDGATANTANPSHTYANTGVYTVTLTVTNQPPGGSNGGVERCGCSDTATMVINVVNGSGPVITSPCNKMLCKGDTATYCASGCTGPYSWTVVGGTPASGSGNCIKVTWNPSPGQQPSITLTAGGSCSPCGNSTTLNVPLLFNGMPITPNNTACQGSTVTYSTLALPGTFYNWTVTGGTLVGPITNTHQVTVNWGLGPTGTISCNYQNPYTGCSGASSQTIQIRPRFTMNGPNSVCVGSGTLFTTNGAANWTIGAPSAAYTFSGSLSGVAAVNISSWNIPGSYNIGAVPTSPSSFCTPSANINLLVKPKPVLSPITGPSPVCLNGFYTYAVSSNLPGSFNWSITGGTILSQLGANKDSVLVQWTGSGATLTVSQTVNGCTTTASFTPTLITSIGTITGNLNVCMDAIETYTIAGPVPPGGYTWSLGNALGTILGYPSANSVQIQWSGGVTPGTTICIIQATACGINSSLVVTVKTPANGTLTASGNLCTPGVTLTTAIPGSPTSYDWYHNGTFVTNTGSPTYTTSLPGFYKVVGKTGCFGYATLFVPNTFTSTVSISTGNLTVICPGDPINVVLTATAQANNTCTYSYQWYLGATPVGSNSPTYTATAYGNYSVVISCGTCTATSNIIPVVQGNCGPGGCGAIYNPLKAIGRDMAGPYPTMDNLPADNAPLSYTLLINPPTASPCNVVSFNASYNFTAPNSVNSGVFWNFGDGGLATSTWSGNSGTSFASPHTYTVPGIYVVSALMYADCPPPPTPHICPVWDTIQYTVPVAANFGYNVNCKTVTLSDLSSTLPSLGCNITAWNWSVSGPAGASFNNNTFQNPVMTVTTAGTYIITLTVTSNCSGCTATVSYPVTITAPTASFTLPTPICAGTAVPFTTTGPAGSSYNWNFGNTYQSNQQTTTHTFATTPVNPVVTLTLTDGLGCTATAQQTLTILPKPALTISPNQFVCPGGSAVITATPGFSNYTWYWNGTNVQSGPSNTYSSGNMGNYWVVANNGAGCSVTSGITHLFHHSMPVANIQGPSSGCLFNGSGTLYLFNSINDAPNGTTYSWALSGGTASPTNNFDLNVIVNTPGNYTFILTAISQDGCIAKDTFCVVVDHAPTVNVTTATTGTLCAGTNHTFTASTTPAGPAYLYQWSNGVTGPVMTTAAPGMYMVTVTNPVTGCSSGGFGGIIQPSPTTILFPVGCDTLCDTAKLIPPLALGAGQNYNMYSIQWLDNGIPISPQPTPQHILPLVSLTPGLHNISIIVTLNGCPDTSGVYNLFVKHCGKCTCDKSNWSDLYWTYNTPATQDTKPVPTNAAKAAVVTPQVTPFKCDGSLGVLDCKTPITLFATYKCNPDSCNQSVTYTLTGTDINGPVNLSGAMPFNTAGLLQGSYTLVLLGKCGDSICKRCVVKFEVKCDSVKDCCKGSYWKDGPYWINNTTGFKDKIDCTKGGGNTYYITGKDCNSSFSLGGTFICNGDCPPKVVYTLYDALSNVVASGTNSFTLPAGLPNGGYTLTIQAYCGDLLCSTCNINIKKDCPVEVPCNCRGSKWETITLATGTASPKDEKAVIDGVSAMGLIKLNCGKMTALKCNQSYTINAGYNCPQPACPGMVQYQLTTPSNTVTTGPVPLIFTPAQSGTYTLVLYGYCGNTICDSCVITFKVECQPVPCCPHEIKVKPAVVQTSTLPSPAATIANASFGFSGPSGNLFTEVRATVVSYTLLDNFNGECLSCKSYPFTWASMYQPGNIGSMTPQITLYNTTVGSFTPSGAGLFQNPREVIWNSTTPFALPATIGLSFLLPPGSVLPCCEVRAKICVRFTFRDKNCKECEVTDCFEVLLPKK
jgi:PKD repeat protein